VFDSGTLTSALTLPFLTENSILFAGSGGSISQDNTNFSWDDTNNRLFANQLRLSGLDESAVLINGGGDYIISSSLSSSNAGSFNATALLSGISSVAGSAAFTVTSYDTPTTSNGDSYLSFLTRNTSGGTVLQPWSLGTDNSDSRSFKISSSEALGTNDYFKIASSGDISFGSNFSFDVSEPQFKIGSDIGTFDGISIGQSANADIRVGQGASNNVILGWKYDATASSAYSILETFAGNNNIYMQTSGGSIGIGKTGATSLLDVNGTIASLK